MPDTIESLIKSLYFKVGTKLHHSIRGVKPNHSAIYTYGIFAYGYVIQPYSYPSHSEGRLMSCYIKPGMAIRHADIPL